MRGMLGGVVSGGMVSVLALSVASVVSEQPAGVTPPEPPLVDAPKVEVASDPVESTGDDAVSTPVGSLSIDEPQAPALPDAEAALNEPASPVAVDAVQTAPRADTDPLDEPLVVAIEGTLDAPETSEIASVLPDAIDPVLPNPQSVAPQTPLTEANLTVSTAPAAPVVVLEPDPADDADSAEVAELANAPENGSEAAQITTDGVVIEGSQTDETFVVDLGVEAIELPEPAEVAPNGEGAEVQDGITDATPFADTEGEAEVVITQAPSRFQLQGDGSTFLPDRDTGVTIRRPGAEPFAAAVTEGASIANDGPVNALVDYAAVTEETGDKPLMTIVLIDDGSMSAAAAALAGLPFDVTIALDPAMDGASELLDQYRADGFEVAALAKLPDGAVPSDVEVTLESVFRTLPETIAVLDVGESGLQSDRDVTAQTMDILASQGRGFVTISTGLNTAQRAAEQAGVPAGIVYRDLDADDQDARVIRRFVDQAAFRARQGSGVILAGRVRPDTISALILWGTARQDDQVAVVPLSAVLNAQ